MTGFEDLSVLTEASAAYLNPRQRLDYKAEREDCLEWLLTFGKDPQPVCLVKDEE
ncbi:hypothetical protein [Halobellus rubicundus]|uniref:Uncharacterized protein n=1 Tax=Halobellus rubicundus TaxID=2996466 RepID=A0ABD5MA35_9EURY